MKQNILALQQADIIRRAEWIAEQTNDLQLIKAYLSARLGEMVLNENQLLKLKRWQYIYDQMSTGKYTDADIRFQVIKVFGLSDSAARADMRQAQDVFATTLSINKKFKIQLDIQLLDIQQQKCRDTNNMEAYSKLQRVKNELYKMLPDEEEEAPIDYFQPRTNQITFNPSLLGHKPIPPDQMKDLIEELKNEFNMTDIDYEMLEPNTDDSTNTLQ